MPITISYKCRERAVTSLVLPFKHSRVLFCGDFFLKNLPLPVNSPLIAGEFKVLLTLCFYRIFKLMKLACPYL